jgi:hypothetical protein
MRKYFGLKMRKATCCVVAHDRRTGANPTIFEFTATTPTL